MWNLWVSLFLGALIYTITGIYWLGFLFAGVITMVTFVISDIYAPYLENYYGIKGISMPNPQTIIWAPVTGFINFVINKIPFIKKINIFYEELQYKLGIMGEPIIVGFIMGAIIGAITKYREFSINVWQSIIYCLSSGIYLALIYILMPRFISLLYRGLIPVINDIKTFINSKITKREIYLGINPVMLAGNSSIIGLSSIMIPLTVYIATILPGNSVLPSADLILIPLLLIWVISISRGDIFRSFISAVIIIPLILLVSSNMTSFITGFMLNEQHEQLVEGYNNYSSMGMGSNVIFWILTQIIKPIIKLFS
jgi:PTS system galactitol-specific IIC component